MTFDIMSHLTFGESFDSVDAQDQDPYTEDFFQKMSIFPIIYASREYGVINWFIKTMMKVPAIAAAEKEWFRLTKERVDKRINGNALNKVDFMKYVSSVTHSILQSYYSPPNHGDYIVTKTL